MRVFADMTASKSPVSRFATTPPLGLYVHIPWCVRKCPYCDFNSHATQGDIPEAGYVDALLTDLESQLPAIWGRTVESVFIGGGTPSLFSAPALERLLTGVRSRLRMRPDAEITLEANPGTAEAARFADYRAAGVNRLSIGVQSLDDAGLRALGRIHDANAALAAVAMAQQAGFENINLDMMFGLPQQSCHEALSDLARLLDLEPAHISYYQLPLEPNTAFHHRPPPLPQDDDLAAMQEQGAALLARAGYRQYEVSAYAKDNRRCRHNLNYWKFGDYLGIGAGAHGKLTDAAGNRVVRRHNRRHPNDYLRDPAVPAGEKVLSAQDLRFEFMLNGLRLVEGIDRALFSERTGLSEDWLLEPLRRARSAGLLDDDETTIRPSELGRRFLNDLMAMFLPEEDCP